MLHLTLNDLLITRNAFILIFSPSDILSDVLLLSKVRFSVKFEDSASNVRTFEADSVSEPIREPYI